MVTLVNALLHILQTKAIKKKRKDKKLFDLWTLLMISAVMKVSMKLGDDGSFEHVVK